VTLLLSCQSLSKSFGTRDLFEDLSLSLFERDRVGLIGLNGVGKSTFLKILAGQEKADSGIVAIYLNLVNFPTYRLARFFSIPSPPTSPIMKESKRPMSG
jgi:ABC-type sugar transport system ATPase subunit